MTAPIKPSAPWSPKTYGRDHKQNNNDACAQRRLQKKEQKKDGTGGCRSPTNAPVVKTLLSEPPSAHNAEATCKSCNKQLDPNNPCRLGKHNVYGRWHRSCFLCMQARWAAASLAAILLRLKALETAVAAPHKAMVPQRALPPQHGHPLTKAPVAPTAASTTFPAPPVGPHLFPTPSPFPTPPVGPTRCPLPPTRSRPPTTTTPPAS